jgi:hypothetical protein
MLISNTIAQKLFRGRDFGIKRVEILKIVILGQYGSSIKAGK